MASINIDENRYSSDVAYNNNFNERIRWALTPYPNGLASIFNRTPTQTKDQIRAQAKRDEKLWGNNMIGQNNNPNWTTTLGETLVFDVLQQLGRNPRRPQIINGYHPDWETDDCIYEVKTRNWTTSGTAGEKVFGTMYKYSDIPTLYKKPLKIVCVAYQEYELTHCNTRIFADLSDTKRAFIELARSLNIEYIRFSDLVRELRG